jgi:O-acetyl-ADP-ribose deacetylase (regulator of RNase III)
MWAMLLAVRKHNHDCPDRAIQTIACPGMGTGIGQVPYGEAARLMALAYDHFLYPPKVINTFVAAERQLAIWEG